MRDKRTDTRNRIWCISALKCDPGVNNYYDFPDNQLTKFRYVYWLIPNFTPLKFLRSITLPPAWQT